MAIKYVVVHRKDTNNVGDMASNPLQYFLSPDEYQTVDIIDLYETAYPSNIPVIVGGGGLLENEYMGDTLRSVLHSADRNQLSKLWKNRWELQDPSNTDIHAEFIDKYQTLINEHMDKLKQDTSPRFMWGVGHNGEVTKKNKSLFAYPEWLVEFDLVGVRDWGQNLKWIPCASCMHPALRKSYAIKNDIIWFEHKKQLIKDFGNETIPRFTNSGDNIEQTIELLGSANIILTNSYHGAYWGALLKKRVIVVGPWSTKFYGMKHMPAMVDKTTSWRDMIDDTRIHHTALDECVKTTESFWKQIVQRS
jgi:hypothetical protein